MSSKIFEVSDKAGLFINTNKNLPKSINDYSKLPAFLTLNNQGATKYVYCCFMCVIYPFRPLDPFKLSDENMQRYEK